MMLWSTFLGQLEARGRTRSSELGDIGHHDEGPGEVAAVSGLSRLHCLGPQHDLQRARDGTAGQLGLRLLDAHLSVKRQEVIRRRRADAATKCARFMRVLSLPPPLPSGSRWTWTCACRGGSACGCCRRGSCRWWAASIWTAGGRLWSAPGSPCTGRFRSPATTKEGGTIIRQVSTLLLLSEWQPPHRLFSRMCRNAGYRTSSGWTGCVLTTWPLILTRLPMRMDDSSRILRHTQEEGSDLIYCSSFTFQTNHSDY